VDAFPAGFHIFLEVFMTENAENPEVFSRASECFIGVKVRKLAGSWENA